MDGPAGRIPKAEGWQGNFSIDGIRRGSFAEACVERRKEEERKREK